MASTDIARAIGRIEGVQKETHTLLTNLRDDFIAHKQEDTRCFIDAAQRDEKSATNLDLYNKLLDAKLEVQSIRLKNIDGYVDRIKGAWWIVAFLVAVIAAFGAALNWLVNLFRISHH